MALHPQAVAFLRARDAHGVLPDHQLGVEVIRARADVRPREVEAVSDVRDVVIDGPAGDLRLRVVTPAAEAWLTDGRHGVVLYLHGGGHVTGSLDSYEGLTRRLANRAGTAVVSVDYRRAPEHRCPAPVDDAEAAFDWLLAQGDDVGADVRGRADRVVLAGDSAGGNNAAVLARRLRDRARSGPGSIAAAAAEHRQRPALQVLLYPTLDAVAYRDGKAHQSYVERGSGYGLTYPDGLYYWDHYLGPHGDASSPDASPLRVADLTELAPAYVMTVEYDVLRDEGFSSSAALAAAGVPVTHHHVDQHLHGFLGDPGAFDDADPALARVGKAIRAALDESDVVPDCVR